MLEEAVEEELVVVALEQEKAEVHLKFATQIYREQIEGGRFFLHEHPDHARSWEEQCVAELLEIEGVSRVSADQCQYGQQAPLDPWEGNQ